MILVILRFKMLIVDNSIYYFSEDYLESFKVKPIKDTYLNMPDYIIPISYYHVFINFVINDSKIMDQLSTQMNNFVETFIYVNNLTHKKHVFRKVSLFKMRIKEYNKKNFIKLRFKALKYDIITF